MKLPSTKSKLKGKTMKILCVLLLFVTITSYSQSTYFNLEGIKTLNVTLKDQDNILNESYSEKLLTETKLKLKSAGIEISIKNPQLIISLSDVNRKEFIAWLRIEEVGKFIRGKKTIEAKVISYSSLQKSQYGFSSQKNAYEFIIDKLILPFLDQYIEENKRE